MEWLVVYAPLLAALFKMFLLYEHRCLYLNICKNSLETKGNPSPDCGTEMARVARKKEGKGEGIRSQNEPCKVG